MTSGWPCPTFVMRTPDDQSIQRLPHWSSTVKFSALCQRIGGWPDIERGSLRRSSSNTGSDSGTGRAVRMVRYLVWTGRTLTGFKSYSGIDLLHVRTVAVMDFYLR